MRLQTFGEPILRTDKLAKTYGGRTAVDQMDLDLHPGKIAGLLGPHGAGKTTALSMMMGLVGSDGGRVFLEGNDVTQLPAHRRARMGLSYLPEGDSLIRTLTVRENLLAILETQPPSQEPHALRCDELLTQLGIASVANQPAQILAQGQKRRLALARCLLNHPKVLLLDEPFEDLDAGETEELQEHIGRLRDTGVAILISAHRVLETLEMVDRAYMLFEGKVVTQGTRDFLLSEP